MVRAAAHVLDEIKTLKGGAVGDCEYNVGAGMARINTAASFIHSLMPIDRAQQLTPQQAFDVATYINTRPRPRFPPKVHDFPRGGKPPDADYHFLPAPSPPKGSARPSVPK